MKKIFLSVLALIIAVMSTAVAVFGWLAVGTSINPGDNGYSGSVLSNYFASGDGSESSPYEINRPNHLYNLAWLQNYGYFTTQNYFQITADLNMSGYVLPPIGTKTNPFIGILNGKNNNDKICKIYNLTVSNVEQNADDNRPNEVSPIPSNMTGKIGNGSTDIVGFFGVIGHHPDSTCNASSLAEEVSVSNLYLDNITIRTRTTNSLIGLFAGYVCGNVSNVGVYRSMVSIGSGVSALNDTYISDSKQTLSKYSLIGDYHEKSTGWESAEGGSGGESEGAGFGGSIDMQLLSRRVNYMTSRMLNTAKVTPTLYSYQVNESSSYNANYITKYNSVGTNFNLNAKNYNSNSKAFEFYWKTLGTSSYIQSDFLRHTYLPLNVDLTAMGLDSSDEKTFSTSESPQGFHINTEYLAATSETVAKNNTGYIVGGAQSEQSSGAYTQLKVQLLTRNDGYTIYKSLGSERTSVSYDKNKLVLISTDSNGSFGWIEDSYNSSTYKDNTSALKVDYTTDISSSSFNRYGAVIEQFHTLLSSSANIYGLYFYDTINLNNTTEGSGVKINGTPYDSYEFLDSSVNFSLNQSGYMTAIIGTYYSYSTSSSLRSGFSLYHVVRDSDKKVATASTKEITSVWKNLSGDIKYNYSATAVDNTAPATGYTKVYDKYWYSGTLQRGTAYYVEIPLVSGDYAIGAMDYYSDYLMYLDIGANGESGGSGESGTTPIYKIEGVRFVYLLNEVYDTLNDFYAFQIVRSATTSGTQIYFYKMYDVDSASVVMYYYRDIDNTDTTVIANSNNTTTAVEDKAGTAKSAYDHEENPTYPPL